MHYSVSSASTQAGCVQLCCCTCKSHVTNLPGAVGAYPFCSSPLFSTPFAEAC